MSYKLPNPANKSLAKSFVSIKIAKDRTKLIYDKCLKFNNEGRQWPRKTWPMGFEINVDCMSKRLFTARITCENESIMAINPNDALREGWHGP